MSITLMEFFGLPGCGKTSLLNETAKSYEDTTPCYYPNMLKIGKQQDDPVLGSTFKRNSRELIVNALRIKNIETLFHILSLYLKSKTNSRVVFQLSLTMYLYFLNLASTRTKISDGFVLSDNGFVQIMISILKRSRTSDLTCEDFFRILDRYDFDLNFFYLELSPELSRARIYERGKDLSVMQQGAEKALEQLTYEFDLFNRVYGELETRYRCYKLDSAQSLENVVSDIRGILD